jgi:hypothetical protein
MPKTVDLAQKDVTNDTPVSPDAHHSADGEQRRHEGQTGCEPCLLLNGEREARDRSALRRRK